DSKTVSAANDRTRARFSTILNEGNKRDSQSATDSWRGFEMDDGQNERGAGGLSNSGFQSHTGGASESIEELSTNESLSDDLFFRDSNSIWERGHSASRVLPGNQVGGGGDDEDRKKKRKRKR